MTTIYVPRLIESAEQAEALPWGTVAFDQARMHCALQKEADNYWFGDRSLDNEQVAYFGYTALVPIEAEEELQRTYALAASTFPGLSWPEQHDAWKRRLVTPWEEA